MFCWISQFVSCFNRKKLISLSISSTGPDGSEVMTNFTEVNGSNFRLDYTPTVVGELFSTVSCYLLWCRHCFLTHQVYYLVSSQFVPFLPSSTM